MTLRREPSSQITHRRWMAMAAEEYRRLDEVLGAMTEDQWSAPTECPGWAVRDVVAHLIGAAEAGASVREQLRQQRIGGAEKGDGLQIDAVNELQVRERTDLSPEQLRQALREAGSRGVRGRTRTPAPMRALLLRLPPPVGWTTLGFLVGTVYTRDAWMHRIDICRAIGATPTLTPEHDGAIAADALRSWQHATGRDEVQLTGPAGSTAEAEPGHTSYDAVEFARALSGRTQLPGIRGDLVLF